jgi:integrase/recombinase XerD
VNKKTLAVLPPWLQDLLERMDEEMALRGFTRETRRVYLAHVRRFYMDRGLPDRGDCTSLEELSEAPIRTDLVATSREVRDWLLRKLRDGLSHSHTNQALSALRFLHQKVLGAPAPVAGIPRAKAKKTLPVVLSESEVRRFLDALGSPKQRAIAFVLYSGGLRVSEAARLKITDIDSERGQIHVRQGKGGKDRYVMLSPVVLGVLREYVRVERPYDWLFPRNDRRDRHITTRAIQGHVKSTGKRAGIEKWVTPHVLRHNAESRIMPSGPLRWRRSLGPEVYGFGIIRGILRRRGAGRRGGIVPAWFREGWCGRGPAP